MSIPVRFLCLLLSLLGLAAGPAAAQLRGCWVAPETIFREDRVYSLQERATLIGQALDRMRSRGIDTVLLESFVRGYATCRISAGPSGDVAVPERFRPRTRSEPDLLSLFIEQAAGRGMKVHAWVHMCYLRSDSITRTRDDDDTLSLFHDLLLGELKAARERARSSRLQGMLDSALSALERGYDSRSLAEALRVNGYGFTHTPLQTLVDALHEAGVPGPALFTYGPRGELHPPLDAASNGSIYLDPAHPEVLERLVDVVGSLIDLHPGLAGIHLDHIRFPEGSYGHRPDASRGTLRFVPAGGKGREEAITALVAACKARVAGRLPISAAVLPAQNGAGQDWQRWGLAFYTPMLYSASATRLASLMAGYRRSIGGKAPVYPGIASLARAKGQAGWVLFDYSTIR